MTYVLFLYVSSQIRMMLKFQLMAVSFSRNMSPSDGTVLCKRCLCSNAISRVCVQALCRAWRERERPVRKASSDESVHIETHGVCISSPLLFGPRIVCVLKSDGGLAALEPWRPWSPGAGAVALCQRPALMTTVWNSPLSTAPTPSTPQPLPTPSTPSPSGTRGHGRETGADR